MQTSCRRLADVLQYSSATLQNIVKSMTYVVLNINIDKYIRKRGIYARWGIVTMLHGVAARIPLVCKMRVFGISENAKI